MQVPLFNQAGEQINTVELRDDIFGLEPNAALMHQALMRQFANARQGTHDTKTRGEVSGGGRKPWRQKGTGRARQGSTRAPHWKGGGVVFGPHPRGYEQKMPKKMRRLALKSALSVKARDNQIRVVDELRLESPRTREMDALLSRLNCSTTTLILLPEANEPLVRSARNLDGVKTLRATYLNIRDLLDYDNLLLSQRALQAIENWFAAEDTAQPATAGGE